MSYTYEYPRPAVTTDALVTCKRDAVLFILLIRRGIEPFKGKWALPGGFVNMDEELDDACARELKEETGISNVSLKQFATYGSLNRDPRGRTISVVYAARINSKPEPKGGDDADKAQWFDVNSLPELAFDHAKIIQDYLSKSF